MKKPEEYLKGLFEEPYQLEDENSIDYDFLQVIKQAQIDAYNEAIDDAVENAKLKDKKIEYTGVRAGGYYVIKILNKQSILKLKK